MWRFVVLYFSLFFIFGCGIYLDSLKDEPNNSKDLSISELRNFKYVNNGGSYSCYVSVNAATEVMNSIFKVGVSDINMPQEVLDQLVRVFGDDTPEIDSLSIALVPDINQILAKNNIDSSDFISDWSFGAVTIGKNHIFIPLNNEKVIPFYSNNSLIPTESDIDYLARLLGHEFTHIIQMRQKKAEEKVSKSCVVQHDVSRFDRYDYTLSTVDDLFNLGMEASAEIIENTITLGQGIQSSSHDLENTNKDVTFNLEEHLNLINNSTGF